MRDPSSPGNLLVGLKSDSSGDLSSIWQVHRTVQIHLWQLMGRGLVCGKRVQYLYFCDISMGVQERHNSSANVLELHLSCTDLLIYGIYGMSCLHMVKVAVLWLGRIVHWCLFSWWIWICSNEFFKNGCCDMIIFDFLNWANFPMISAAFRQKWQNWKH